ncbi:MAG: hypothetical protein IAG10_05460 [Planctomycetaceae bacterium]|nr:hypothetical protein [Planctomycetaceae bacterium]
MIDLRCTFLRMLLSLAVIGTMAADARSAEPPGKDAKESDDSSPKDEKAKARQEHILKAMQKYEVVLDGNEDKKATLDSKALLRWSNPLGDVADGLMSVYSTGPTERPAMLAHIYVHGAGLNGLAMQEFADVHPGQIELFRGKRKVWSPRSRYSKFETLPDGPKPSDSAALRLTQIKQMAARFEIIDGFRETNAEPKPHVLRMMSRPTYRYGKADGEIIDGALFTFVVATDPEACLLIEIHRKGEVTSWEYMVLPMTIYSLDVKLDGKPVWTKPEAMVFGDPTAPHYISPYQHDQGEAPFKSLLPTP